VIEVEYAIPFGGGEAACGLTRCMGSDLLISSIHLRPNGVLNIFSRVFIYYRALHSSPTHLLDIFYLKEEGKYSHVTPQKRSQLALNICKFCSVRS